MCFCFVEIGCIGSLQKWSRAHPGPPRRKRAKLQLPTLCADTTHKDDHKSTYKTIQRYYRGTGRAAIGPTYLLQAMGCFVPSGTVGRSLTKGGDGDKWEIP